MLGMTVAHTFLRKTKITITTRAMVSIKVNCTSSTDCPDRRRSIGQDGDMDVWRDRRLETPQRLLDLLDGLDDVRAGLLEDHEKDVALAVAPGGLGDVRGTPDGLADVAARGPARHCDRRR